MNSLPCKEKKGKPPWHQAIMVTDCQRGEKSQFYRRSNLASLLASSVHSSFWRGKKFGSSFSFLLAFSLYIWWMIEVVQLWFKRTSFSVRKLLMRASKQTTKIIIGEDRLLPARAPHHVAIKSSQELLTCFLLSATKKERYNFKEGNRKDKASSEFRLPQGNNILEMCFCMC